MLKTKTTEQSHVVIISAVYPPEPMVSARMSRDLANYLKEKRFNVSVLCPSPSRPLNSNYVNLKSDTSTITYEDNGVEVVRLPSFTFPKANLVGRFLESWSFGQCVCKYLECSLHMPTVMYVNSWPLLSQALILRFANRQKIPVVLQIMDIYPESLFNKLPSMFRGCVTWPLLKLDSWIARKSRYVSVISESMRKTYLIKRCIPAEKIVVVPTWQDELPFLEPQDRLSASSRYGVDSGRFTFLYLGNVGPVAGVDVLIKSFSKASIAGAQLLIAGDGSAKAECQELVSSLTIQNIHFISDIDAANVPLIQSMADVCLLPVRRGAAMSSIPSKLPAYMFSSKPVIASVDCNSDTAKTIREAGCGWVGEPEDIEWLSSTMRRVAEKSSVELKQLGGNGMKYASTHFSKSICLDILSNAIIDCQVGKNVL